MFNNAGVVRVFDIKMLNIHICEEPHLNSYLHLESAESIYELVDAGEGPLFQAPLPLETYMVYQNLKPYWKDMNIFSPNLL